MSQNKLPAKQDFKIQSPKYRLNDFAGFEMYKSYLNAHGYLNQGLEDKNLDWKAYLKASGKKIDL